MAGLKELILKKNEEKRVLAGHLWVFSNEIKEIKGEPAAGDVVRLLGNTGEFIGSGFFNPHSLIAFRLLSRKEEEINFAFWEEKIRSALLYRREIYPESESFRVVFGESDGLPGLIADKYCPYLSVQFLSVGIEKNRETIVSALKEVLSPQGIIARNDSVLRKLEGLEEKIEVLDGEIPERVEIEENDCSYYVDLQTGQKTGFFFDQRENRRALAQYCSGKTVLDCFCYLGAFGIGLAKNGASKVIGIDSSETALRLAKENARLNGVSKVVEVVRDDVGDYLDRAKKETKKFDLIILDPPALIKNKKSFLAGYRLYRKLNTLALEILDSGGILATSSCSHHLSPEDFRKMLRESAGRVGKQVRLLELRSQARDHPILLAMPETEYLKFAILEVI